MCVMDMKNKKNKQERAFNHFNNNMTQLSHYTHTHTYLKGNLLRIHASQISVKKNTKM